MGGVLTAIIVPVVGVLEVTVRIIPAVMECGVRLNTTGIIAPPSREEYWAEVARLRGEQVKALLQGNNPIFALRSAEVTRLEGMQNSYPVAGALSQDNRQALKDSLAALTKAVEKILE